MSAFKVNGEGNVGSQRHLWARNIIRGRKLYGASRNVVQELRLDDAWFAAYFRLDRVLYSYHKTPCAPKLVRSVWLSSHFFLLFLLWKRLATRLSLVS